MLWFILLSNLVILQVILIDIGLTKSFPILLLFYLPFQFLCPVLFVAFTYSYVDRFGFFKKYRFLFLLPFGIFLVLYTLLKVNVFLDYAWISKGMAAWIGAELDENSALAFSLFAALWNYRVIRRYENELGGFPYQLVIKKTAWLKKIFVIMTVLCFLWVLVILYLKIDENVSGHGPYYPLWLLFIGYYVGCLIWGSKHIKQVEDKKTTEKATLRSVNENFQISGLQKIFSETELSAIQESRHQVTEILGYFATSLFDKNTESDVLWDIVKNCISKLKLEDCVIYLHDKKSNMLVQKAAFGDKDMGGKKIVSPIEIPLGKGIVGSVAQNLQWEIVNDISQDSRYLFDVRSAKSELTVPIIHENNLVGVLDSENSMKGFFTEKHLLVFQLIAKLTATKLYQIKKNTGISLTDDNCYYKQFVSWLEGQKKYLDPNLSLQISSEHLNISPGYLSQIINQLGGINFSEFVNVYRVNASKKMLINPEFGNYTILAIGLEAGFNSKSAFYNAFKKQTGETPSEYRQRYLMVS
ncbi:helix-turn-helix domain-containing protein [Flagellimonas allohymeniacidonis]|nr:helix-turn-helix domain-containing protein [Allomuricauda hymeniacidonis]